MSHATCSSTPTAKNVQPAFIVSVLFVVNPKKSNINPKAIRMAGGLFAITSNNTSSAVFSPPIVIFFYASLGGKDLRGVFWKKITVQGIELAT
jgi:hypothetical protein